MEMQLLWLAATSTPGKFLGQNLYYSIPLSICAVYFDAKGVPTHWCVRTADLPEGHALKDTTRETILLPREECHIEPVMPTITTDAIRRMFARHIGPDGLTDELRADCAVPHIAPEETRPNK